MDFLDAHDRVYVVEQNRDGQMRGLMRLDLGPELTARVDRLIAQVKGSAASMLFEFDPALKYVKEWGPNNYAAGFAHTVRVDKDDNVWATDEGTNIHLQL